ncbi:hypothetical protein [Rhizobium sp. PAMB 3182]
MVMSHRFRVGAGIAAALVASVMATGCVGSPTYGTGKTSAEQLVDDLGSSVSLSNKEAKEKQKIALANAQPRPTLVVPSNPEQATLVPPEQSLASKSNPAWVESPEETRARLLEEATANQDSSTYRSPLAASSGTAKQLSEKEQQQAYREARKLQKGAYLDQRRYLSDPPDKFRTVQDPAVLADVGEPERIKEKRRKKEAVAERQRPWTCSLPWNSDKQECQ